ncbi:NAD(P)-dependent alcohol dehydrogenase [Sandaracinobacteroides saxicola]|uniref:NAD(P)-dependent alcohol dehydrogenase n=2 Tax=Sandaracinobacteroides saxicola TaxID=2759707 RepID=A0A7G5IL55_9SPHN|nr:NAD(P)-dependent alcohol dehydrogenase [Sandaracinobacteroides saxicola]
MAADLPAPGPGQLLVTIHAAGICHTDLGFRDLDMPNAMPIVLGHEGAGTVAALGPGVTGFAVGDRVCLSYDSCGHCGACTGHAPQYCDELGLRNFAGVTPAMAPPMAFPDGTPLFGNFFGQSSFATHALSTVRNTVKIPDALPFHLAAPLGCGMQTGAGTVVNSLAGAPGKSLVVFGTGSVGLAAIMAAAALGMAPIVAVDRVQSRLALARALGATHGLTADEASLVSLAAISPGFDGSFDTTGVPGVIQLAIDCLGTRGTCALVGITPPGTLASFSPAGFLMGKKIIGVIEGDADPQIFVPWLAKQHLAGRFPHDRLVTTFPFDRINDAVDAMHQGEVVKPVLLMP